MKNIFYIIIFSAFVFSSCSKKQDARPAPVACFTVDRDTVADASHLFNFTNCSSGAVHYEWDFGDGHTSEAATPGYIYSQWGVFTVTLTAHNQDGATSTMTKTIVIGHYSLIRVIFNSVAEPLPMYFLLNNYNSLVLANVHLTSAAALPDTFNFPDSPVYDMQYDGSWVYYEESDGAGNSQWGSGVNVFYSVLDNSPEHKQVFGLSNGSNNAFFTMYFKFLVR